MKATINLEYSSEELEKFLSNAGVTMLTKLFRSMAIKIDPSAVPAYIDYFKQGFEQAMAGGGFRMPHHHGPPGYPPPTTHHHGPPGYVPRPGGGSSNAYFQEMLKRQQELFQQRQAMGDPDNVQPIRDPDHVDRCFAIEATHQNEGGIGCCQCATYNGAQRTHCRSCGHKLCVIETPPPASPVGEGG